MLSRPALRPVADGELLATRRYLRGRFTAVELGHGVLALALAVLGIGEIAQGRWHSPAPVAVLDLLLVTIPLATLARVPLVAGLVASLALVWECSAFTTPQSLTVLFAGLALAGGVARFAAVRWLPVALVVLCGVALVVALRDPTNENRWDYLFTLGLWLAAGGFGLLLRRRHAALVRALEETVRVRTEQTVAVQRALAEERSRIARDLHDVVAHAVSLMVIQAAAARAVLAATEPQAHGALDLIEHTGKRALGDLRRLLDVLRSVDEDGNVEPPGLAAIDALVEEVRHTGIPCTLTRRGPLDGVPEGVGVAAYRVVQESLTNAVKHGSREHIDIETVREPLGLRVRVRDKIEPRNDTRSGLQGAGRGLAGMRERVEMYGGTLSVGPREGGWRVEAFWPLTGAI